MEPSAYNAHEKAPKSFRNEFKRLQKSDNSSLSKDCRVIDFANMSAYASLKLVGKISKLEILRAVKKFEGQSVSEEAKTELSSSVYACSMYEHDSLPGFQMIPGILPLKTQKLLLSRLLHRDLLDQGHKTNIHFHHELPYEAVDTSFFSAPFDSTSYCSPRKAATHTPILIQSLLEKKLRWVTLGGQYDWTLKRYPPEKPPDFPRDISALLEDLFPHIKTVPEAAIVNLYTPGDTLSMHRDVSESADEPLISISIGCDAIFMIGGSVTTNGAEITPLAIRVKSGDAILMGGPSRFAWHGIPKVIPNTCPTALQDWPVDDLDNTSQMFTHWKGWMKRKRINLNVRQMYDR